MSDSMKPSRREFLKGTTAAAAGIALAGGLDIARTAHAAGSDELKIALIGCGGRGTGAVVNCLSSCKNVRLMAMGDVFKQHAEGSLEQLRKDKGLLANGAVAKIDVPPERMFIGFDAFQKVIDTGPDIVFLTTPPAFRPAHYAAAVAAGRHVFMEKPVCVDAPGFRSVMDTNHAADKKGLKVVVGLQRRHSKQFLGPVKAIQDGSLGQVIYLRCVLERPAERLCPPPARRDGDGTPDPQLEPDAVAQRRPYRRAALPRDRHLQLDQERPPGEGRGHGPACSAIGAGTRRWD